MMRNVAVQQARCRGVLVIACLAVLPPGAAADTVADAGLVVKSFLTDAPLCRAGRPAGLTATVVNDGPADVEVSASLVLPPGVRLRASTPTAPPRLATSDGEQHLRFEVEAEKPGPAEIVLELSAAGTAVVRRLLVVNFLPPLPVQKLAAVPPPEPVATDMLVGAIHCPLWESDRVDLWRGVLRHPERMPALGLYSQEDPEVADWEAKWAAEHGISFFVYCWYRDGKGGAVRTRFGRGLHDGLFKSRHAGTVKFAILWENQDRDRGGVDGERDLLGNLVPYWIENYFKRSDYLAIDGQPVLFVYDTEGFIKDLGGPDQAQRAVAAMREACRKAGFTGLTLLGEYRGFDPRTLERMRTLGLDASFAYCWHLPGSPAPDQAVSRQLDAIRAVRDQGVLPQVVTVSQGWSGWHDEGTVWSIPPDRFARLLREAKEIASHLPEGQIGRRMMLIDNWNEWGEGHFIAPARGHGFGYLDAVREVFSPAAAAHVDLIPEDIGLGPYDTPVRSALARREQLRPLLTRRTAAPALPDGLVGRWSFDEPRDEPVVRDVSGHRLGGELVGAERADGITGGAIACGGGVAVVPDDPLLSVPESLTLDCWVRTDVADQHNRWIVNRVFGGGEATGYRLGLLGGKPCFEVPQAPWSHHLTAPEPLPLGRWVHLAGTFDGQRMRLFVDGVEAGALDRPGPIHPSHFDLVIGGFAAGSRANFEGRVDEVRLFSKALGAAEIAAQHEAMVRAAAQPGPPESASGSRGGRSPR
jgi:hypothetical protein